MAGDSKTRSPGAGSGLPGRQQAFHQAIQLFIQRQPIVADYYILPEHTDQKKIIDRLWLLKRIYDAGGGSEPQSQASSVNT